MPSKMVRHGAVILVLLGFVACGGDAQDHSRDGDAGAPGATSVTFVALPPLFGHHSVTHIVASDPAGVVRVELYLDGGRVGIAEFAPFDVEWDASSFTEGAHRLRALAYATDGGMGSAEVDIQIDHTPPKVGLLAATARRDEPFSVTATDPAGVATVVVQRGADRVASLSAPPFTFAWPGGACGAVEIHIIVTDQLGNTIDVPATVEAVDTHDLDCDGAPAVAFGGTDCDDTTAAFGPFAADPGGTLNDYNCDGVPGVDADHDGVPSVETGGTDCDDTSSSAHGGWPGWTAVTVDLGPSAGSSFVAYDATSDLQALGFVGSDGALRFADVVGKPTGPVHAVPEVVALGADSADDRHQAVIVRAAGAVATDVTGITYFAGASLMLATRSSAETSWTLTEVDRGDDHSRLRRAQLARDNQGGWYVVYEFGTDAAPLLRYATNQSGTWVTHVIEMANDETVARDPRIAIHFGHPAILFRTERRLWLLEPNVVAFLISNDATEVARLGAYEVVDDVTSVLVRFVVRGDTQDTLWGNEDSSRFILRDSRDPIRNFFASDRGVVLQRASRASATTTSIVAIDGLGQVMQKLQDGDIVSAPHSPRAPASVLVRAPGEPLRIAVSHDQTFPVTDSPGGADLDCDGRP